MDDIVTDRAGSILSVQLNRPTKKNAMTSGMYVTLAGIFNDAAQDERTLVVLWHGDAGYEDGDAGRAGPRHRLAMFTAGWVYERTA